MSIIQISKIQHRSGNLADLFNTTLDNAEFGWASDSKRLFIGKTSPAEKVEVLTSYSNISLSQIVGSGSGNLNITGATDGQILSFDGTDWVNKGGSTNKLIDLGHVSNVKITGGAAGYVLETDGLGKLSWTSKGSIRSNIIYLSNDTPILMRVANTTPYVNGTPVTISGVTATAGSNNVALLNGGVFFVKVDPDFATSGNVRLYTDSILTNPVNGSSPGMNATAGTGVAITSMSGSGAGVASGPNTSIQFNNSGILYGSPNLVFTSGQTLTTINLTTTGNILTANANVTTLLVAANANVQHTLNSPNANITTSLIAANANVTTLLTASDANVTGTLKTIAITSGGTATAGTITGDWSLTAGSKLNATYADLAEKYVADANYPPGTVLEFGGPNEVTVASNNSRKIAGVVSTAPAYVMNSTCEGTHVVDIALQGRVPCKVTGIVNKGDLMVSAGAGYATSNPFPTVGSVIGKSLEYFSGGSGIIEIAVGRL